MALVLSELPVKFPRQKPYDFEMRLNLAYSLLITTSYRTFYSNIQNMWQLPPHTCTQRAIGWHVPLRPVPPVPNSHQHTLSHSAWHGVTSLGNSLCTFPATMTPSDSKVYWISHFQPSDTWLSCSCTESRKFSGGETSHSVCPPPPQITPTEQGVRWAVCDCYGAQ